MPVLTDRIQARLAAEVTLAVAAAEQKHGPLGMRGKMDSEVRAIFGDHKAEMFRRFGGSNRPRVVRHPQYSDLWYTLNYYCPECRVSLVRRVNRDGSTRFECARCDLGVECFQKVGEHDHD